MIVRKPKDFTTYQDPFEKVAEQLEVGAVISNASSFIVVCFSGGLRGGEGERCDFWSGAEPERSLPHGVEGTPEARRQLPTGRRNL